jgi:hypothetical protein
MITILYFQSTVVPKRPIDINDLLSNPKMKDHSPTYALIFMGGACLYNFAMEGQRQNSDLAQTKENRLLIENVSKNNNETDFKKHISTLSAQYKESQRELAWERAERLRERKIFTHIINSMGENSNNSLFDYDSYLKILDKSASTHNKSISKGSVDDFGGLDFSSLEGMTFQEDFKVTIQGDPIKSFGEGDLSDIKRITYEK